MSPKLSNYLNTYKRQHKDEVLHPPEVKQRGTITSTDVLKKEDDAEECKVIIEQWAREVYASWDKHYETVERIAKGFLAI